VASGVVAGVAGIIYGAKIGSFSNTFGPPLLFPAFAAVFFGSTQFRSRPNVWGTLLAVYTLAFGVKGLQLAFASGVYWITPLFNGVALVVAVALAARSGALARRRRSLSSPADAPPTSTPSEGPSSEPAPVDVRGEALRA
jgi:ribose transport system permease protein